MSLTFDPASHRYEWDGRHVPSVTQIIREAGLAGPMFAEPFHLERGTAVHEAVALDLQGRLDEASVDPAVAGPLRAWRHFHETHRDHLEVVAIEEPRYHPSGYAGTADLAALWRGERAVIDLKTGAPAPWHAIQTAAYAELFGASARLVVYLGEDGRWSLAAHQYWHDLGIFHSALAVWRWRERHGLLSR